MAHNVSPSLILALFSAILTTLATPLTAETSSSKIISGLRLYKKIAASNDGKNIVISPVGISLAVRMVYLGANGATKAQIEAAMELPNDEKNNTDAMFDFNFQDYDTVEKYYPLSPRPSVPMANRLYGSKEYKFKQDFDQWIREDNRVGPKTLDFKGDADKARKTMNSWVRSETSKTIQEFFPFGSISSDNKLVLISAATFRNSWMYVFDEKETQPQTFHLSNGTDIEVPTMVCGPTSVVEFANNTRLGFELLRLTFQARRERMFFILPHRNQTLAALESIAETMGEAEILSRTEKAFVKIAIPKFAYEQTVDLKEPLEAVGIVDVFDADRANLSRMTNSAKVALTKVTHKSYLAVGERGTGFKMVSGFPCPKVESTKKPVDFNLDRPFLFLVQDVSERSIILRGRVMNPLETK